MLELCCNSFKKFCDADNYEELETASDSLLGNVCEENLEDLILSEKQDHWNAIRLRDCTDNFTANATISFLECAATHTRNLIRGNQGSLRKNLDVQ